MTTDMLVSIVAPCYNERESLPLLEERLRAAAEGIAAAAAPGRRVEIVFVDDGSSDDTGRLLEEMTARLPGSRLVSHGVNRGLGAALRTGVDASRGDVVVTIDSDCTYDPAEIPAMLDLLERAGADLVLGSPYHPGGETENVVPYRLLLSRTLSSAYQFLLRSDIHTFTAIFRAYRRDVLETCPSTENDYLALTQILVGAIERGYRIVEYPTTLHLREFGVSKLRVIRMCRRHGLNVLRLLPGRLLGRRRPRAAGETRP